MVYLTVKRIKGIKYAYLIKSIRLPDGTQKKIAKRVETKNLDKRTAEKLSIKNKEYFLRKEKELNAKWAFKRFRKSYIFSSREVEKLEEMKVGYRHVIKKLRS